MLLNSEMNIERAKATESNVLFLTQLLNSRSNFVKNNFFRRNSFGQVKTSFLGIGRNVRSQIFLLDVFFNAIFEKSKNSYLIIIEQHISLVLSTLSILHISFIFLISHILCISKNSINKSIKGVEL